MATKDSKLRVSQQSEKALVAYICKLLDFSRATNVDFINRMEAIDVAFTRYKAAANRNDGAGMDQYGNVSCNAGPINIVTPVVVSQASSMVAYWSEVYLSGYPIFPVVSNPNNKDMAEALEGIVQDHLVLSESIPEMQLMLQNAARYNRWAVEIAWDPIKTYAPFKDIADFGQGPSTPEESLTSINYIRNINLRNLHWDQRVAMHEVDSQGEYAGYSKPITRMALKDLLNRLQIEKTLPSTKSINRALSSPVHVNDYVEDPILNNYVSSTKIGPDWDAYAGYGTPSMEPGNRKVPHNTSGTYILHTFYLRIVPSDFGLNTPGPNSVQVLKVRMINRDVLISAEIFTGANGRFGIFMGPAIEDGLDTQTQSYAEMGMDIQDASTRLFNIRFADARRRIADRALYNPDMIRPSDINNPYPEAKIPIKPNQLTDNPMQAAYMQIPYDPRGTETVIQDAMVIQDMGRELSGLNNASRGQFQKGNKSVTEFNTIMGNSENRMRLPATVLEYRAFTKIKEQLKLNILQFGQDTKIISPRNSKELEVNIQELQQARLQFELADGYTPKSKMASTEFLSSLLQLIMNSPHLQQVYGTQLPGMLAHLAQLGGVRGMEQYTEIAVKEWQNSMGLQAQIQQLSMQMQQMMQQQAGGQPQQQQPAQGQ